jgi:hypothetical protein
MDVHVCAAHLRRHTHSRHRDLGVQVSDREERAQRRHENAVFTGTAPSCHRTAAIPDLLAHDRHTYDSTFVRRTCSYNLQTQFNLILYESTSTNNRKFEFASEHLHAASIEHARVRAQCARMLVFDRRRLRILQLDREQLLDGEFGMTRLGLSDGGGEFGMG